MAAKTQGEFREPTSSSESSESSEDMTLDQRYTASKQMDKRKKVCSKKRDVNAKRTRNREEHISLVQARLSEKLDIATKNAGKNGDWGSIWVILKGKDELAAFTKAWAVAWFVADYDLVLRHRTKNGKYEYYRPGKQPTDLSGDRFIIMYRKVSLLRRLFT